MDQIFDKEPWLVEVTTGLMVVRFRFTTKKAAKDYLNWRNELDLPTKNTTLDYSPRVADMGPL